MCCGEAGGIAEKAYGIQIWPVQSEFQSYFGPLVGLPQTLLEQMEI